MNNSPRLRDANVGASVWLLLGFLTSLTEMACVGSGAPKLNGAKPAPPANASATLGESTVADVCAGATHSCALNSDAKVACWGNNSSYQASFENIGQLDAPRWVNEFSPARQLRCGAVATCIRTLSGAIECLGNAYQSPTAGVRRRPARIALSQSARDFVVVKDGGCAILADHHLSCWTATASPTAIPVAGIDDAETFATSSPSAFRICVTRTQNAPTCVVLGANEDPRGPVLALFNPRPQPALAGAKSLIFSADYLLCALGLPGKATVACAPTEEGVIHDPFKGTTPTAFLATNGPLACFRESSAARCVASDGDLSLGSSLPNKLTALSLGDRHACAIAQGRALCWGEARSGQLGDGARNAHEGEAVPGIADATSIATGQGVTCAGRRSGKISCWGLSKDWPNLAAADVIDLPLPAALSNLSIVHGFPCGRVGKEDRCWDANGWTARASLDGKDPGAFPGATIISTSADEACAIDRDGRLGCAACAACSPPARRVSWLKGNFTQVASWGGDLDRSACARTQEGRVACFLSGSDGLKPDTVVSHQLAALSEVTKLSASSSPESPSPRSPLACALTRAGNIACWGDPWRVGLGQSSTSAVPPVSGVTAAISFAQVSGLPRATDLAVSESSACALTLEGQVYCWGSNIHGGAPNGTPSNRPTAVAVLWPPR